MELYQELLAHILSKYKMHISFDIPELDVKEIIEREAYKALQKIKAVIEDDSLEDAECFYKIEEIVNIFEGLGSDGGARHDFG